jgi:hypothetical protein
VVWGYPSPPVAAATSDGSTILWTLGGLGGVGWVYVCVLFYTYVGGGECSVCTATDRTAPPPTWARARP